MKLIWKVADKPTGRYRSFDSRAWPNAWWGKPDAQDTRIAALLSCEDEYIPEWVRTGKHKPITITVIHYNHPEGGAGGKRFRLKRQATTLFEAKLLTQQFYDSHPDWLPKEKQT